MTSLADPSKTSDEERTQAVVARLRATFAGGRTRTVEWRTRQLKGLLRLLAERETEIVVAMGEDLGRNAHDAWFGDIAPTKGEVEYAVRHLPHWVRPRRVGLPWALMTGKASYRYEPLGVALVISPWNYPFYLSLGPMVGALAAGNCVILKPSELAPASSAAIADLVPRYLDPDAVAVVEGGATVTQELIGAGVDHVFFTGSSETGRQVMRAAADRLTPVTLELGGKSPAIVTKNADLDVAARRIVFGKLLNSGQTCVAPDYVLVEEDVKHALVSRLGASIEQMTAGQPVRQQIVDERHYRRLEDYLDEQQQRIVAGGSHEGTSIEPTIVLDPDPESAVMRSEIFGPVLPVLGVGSLDEAISFVSSRDKPLAAYLFSEDRGEQERVLGEVSSGGIAINHTVVHLLSPQLPFGGVGESGIGSYHGKWGFECFSHRKATLVMRSRPDLRLLYPPYSARAKRLLRRLA